MTIYELAEKSGLSTATISRALNQETRSKVAANTLNRVDALIKKCGFTPNVAARSLRKSCFRAIGVAIPHVDGVFSLDYFSKMLSGVSSFLLDSEYTLKVIMLKFHYANQFKSGFKNAEGVDGLIVSPWGRDFFSKTLDLDKLDIPCVTMNEYHPDVKAHSVSGDHLRGGALVAEYLHKNGHRNILIVSGPKTSMDSQLRIKGFKSFFTQIKSSVHITEIASDYQATQARDLVSQYFRKKSDTTAVFCFNDEMACAAIEGLKKVRLSCPKDVSVVGYDDDRRAEHFSPPLTTVQVPVNEIAGEAARSLIAFLKKEEKAGFFYSQKLFPVKLVERKSVRKLN